MNYGKTDQAARILIRMRNYKEIALRSTEDHRRDYRKRFNRMLKNHSEIAEAHGLKPLTQADCNLK